MKTVLALFSALLLSMVLSLSVQAALHVKFHPVALIDADKVTLGDIADFSIINDKTDRLSKLVVDSAPVPGKEKRLNIAALLPSLQANAKIDDILWEGSASVTLKRRSIRVSKDQLHQIVIGFLKNEKDLIPDGEIRFVSLRAPEELFLPYGEVSWKVTPSSKAIIDSSAFSIFFRINDKPAQNCTVRGRIEVLRDVVVARQNIQGNTMIKPEQLVLMKKNIIKLQSPCYSLDEVENMLAVKTISTGKAVEINDIETPPIILEGQKVLILARKGNLKITSSGIAKKSGKAGDIIRVKNIQSNKLVYARVDKPGVVLVEF